MWKKELGDFAHYLAKSLPVIWLLVIQAGAQRSNSTTPIMTPLQRAQFTSAKGFVHYPKGLFPNSSICDTVVVNEEELYQAYFSNMYEWQRPVLDPRKPINVNMRIVMQGINAVLEREGIVRISAFLSIKFQDEVHVWNQVYPYACLDSMHLPHSAFWVPEVALLNSHRKYELILSSGYEKFRIFSNGTVNYRPGGTFEIYCHFDLTYMPFDQQICTIEFESWRYTIEYQTMSFGTPYFSTYYWRENEQWLFEPLVKRNKTRKQYLSQYTYDHLTYEFALRRKTGYYWVNVIVPSLIISIAKLSIFALPIDDVIKVHVQFTCLLAYGVFELMIQEDMPRSSEHIPLLIFYIDLSMGYICLAILGEALTFMCLRIGRDKKHRRSVPDWIYLLSRVIGYPLCVSLPIVLQLEQKAKKRKSLEMAPRQETVVSGGPATQVFFSQHQYTNEFSTAFEFGQVIAAEQAVNDKFMMTYSDILPLPTHTRLNPNLSATIDGRMQPENKLKYLSDNKKKNRRLQRWRFLADVIDRFTFFMYLFSVIATPIIMFGIIPSTLTKFQ